jgi:hypothetical protein
MDDPYQRASSTFSTLLASLQCNKPRRQPSATTPLVSCADPLLSWVPYSDSVKSATFLRF